MMRPFILLLVIMLYCISYIQAAEPETILKRVVVPNTEDPQAEVQLLTHNQEVIVRTLLYSPILKRVVAVIDDKERKRWSEESDGFVESQRYRDALFAATSEVWQRFRERSDRAEKRQALSIDFILTRTKGEVVLQQPTLTGAFGALQIVEATELAHWSSRGNYVQENMVEILHDNFALEPKAARELLNQLVQEER